MSVPDLNSMYLAQPRVGSPFVFFWLANSDLITSSVLSSIGILLADGRPTVGWHGILIPVPHIAKGNCKLLASGELAATQGTALIGTWTENVPTL